MAAASRVLVVDDHPLFREALAASLTRADQDVDVAHAASLGEAQAAIGNAAEAPFSLVLLDLQLTDTDSLDGVARLQAAEPDLPLYVVSAADSPDVMRRAQALGARGYLPKTLAPDELVKALRRALELEVVFPPELEEASVAESGDAARRVASLTPSQTRVMEGLAAGLLNKQIAWEMNISEATVKAHMTAILRKLGASNRTQALLVYRSATSLTPLAPT